jgi:hypothetical protein
MISYHCSICGAEAEQGVDAQGGEGALHCPEHPTAVIYSIVDRSRIESLRAEAAAAGDTDQVVLCNLALVGDEEAQIECARVLARAEAQNTGAAIL